tara:strand:- start:5156 stop:5899 length:744 start_codon:yes stop_codon:yes gene_type:complete
MILSRIIHHLRSQNWTAVALEFLIVILGVVIGFQVTDWAARRADRASEATHLGYLVADLRADIAELDETMRFVQARSAALDAILVELTGEPTRLVYELPTGRIEFPTAPPSEAVSDDTVVYLATDIRTYDGNRFAYNTLLNTGDVQLLTDPEQARAIQAYYFEADTLRDMERIMMRFRDDMWRSIHRVGMSRQDRLSLTQFAEIVRGEPQLRAEIRDMWNITQQELGRLRSLRDHAEHVVARIEMSE